MKAVAIILLGFIVAAWLLGTWYWWELFKLRKLVDKGIPPPPEE